MNKCITITLAMVLGAWIPTLGYAVDPSALVETKLSAIHTLDANFTQTVKTKRGFVSRTLGTLVLWRPGRFRWETRQPSAQLVIADGEQVWVYDKDLEQVAVRKQTQSLGAAGALFLSQSTQAVKRDFDVTYAQTNQTETFTLQAKSSKANFERVTLVFHADVLQTIILEDQLGQHTTVTFKQVRLNHPEPEALFTFKVPAGVDVIRQ